MAEDTLHFFKRNVNLSVSVRFYYGDRDGVVLNSYRPMIEVKEKDLKAFKDVNKKAILSGLIVEIPEPIDDWETSNALTEEDISALLSNWLKFKNTIDTIDSIPVLYKMLEAANEKNSSKKIISLIENRIGLVEPEIQQMERGEMAGSYDEGVVLSTRQ